MPPDPDHTRSEDNTMSESFRSPDGHQASPAESVWPSAEALDAVLAAHRLWLESVGREGRQADLRHADLSGRSLWRADLHRARFDGYDLRGADLDHADASGANIDGACLERASLWNARLGKARLCQADLRNANLDHADLSGANLSEADCTEASLWGARLHGADLRTATGLIGDQLANALGDPDTRLPDRREG
ncbi:hypothetical protein GAY30_17045 [Azospirillum brasilense]|nr:hypothetical protein [Azospirillum brasilense]NUB31681.1 hypothetical protein [Azospirillum brasilense]RIW00556.1 pentapeptide repeat-containing protein [Azospirillum brasilense]